MTAQDDGIGLVRLHHVKDRPGNSACQRNRFNRDVRRLLSFSHLCQVRGSLCRFSGIIAQDTFRGHHLVHLKQDQRAPGCARQACRHWQCVLGMRRSIRCSRFRCTIVALPFQHDQVCNLARGLVKAASPSPHRDVRWLPRTGRAEEGHKTGAL
jgi:hypothetical protein